MSTKDITTNLIRVYSIRSVVDVTAEPDGVHVSFDRPISFVVLSESDVEWLNGELTRAKSELARTRRLNRLNVMTDIVEKLSPYLEGIDEASFKLFELGMYIDELVDLVSSDNPEHADQQQTAETTQGDAQTREPGTGPGDSSRSTE